MLYFGFIDATNRTHNLDQFGGIPKRVLISEMQQNCLIDLLNCAVVH